MPWTEWVDLARYVMGALLALSLPPAIAYWFILHPFIGFWRRVGMRKTYWIIAAFYIASMVALFPVRDALLGRDLGLSLPAVLAAVPLLVISGVVARKRKKHLSFKILAGVPELSPEGHGIGLLTEGIYGRIRHPRYVEFTLGCAGWTLFANYSRLYVLVAVSLAALFVIVLFEERELRERFGQAYVDYSARVPRFIPRLR
jgi:protein-S-isoprenylcysteine O-methyltransferase Ste14